MEIGETYNLTATINPIDALYKDVIWAVKDENVVKLDNGKIIACDIGTTTVTVKTLDGEKTSSCIITVIEKQQEILTDKEEYTVIIQERVKPSITLKNIDSYELKILDETIATLVDGQIQGVNVGQTTLNIYGVGTEIVKTVKITVLEKPQESYLLNKPLTLNNDTKIITNIQPNFSLNELESKIELNNLTLIVKDLNDKQVESKISVGTGMTLTFLRTDNTEYDKLTIVIRGEVTGDGIINSADLLKTVKYLKGTTNINSIAGDVTKDGIINSADLLKTVKYLKGTATIDFN